MERSKIPVDILILTTDCPLDRRIVHEAEELIKRGISCALIAPDPEEAKGHYPKLNFPLETYSNKEAAKDYPPDIQSNYVRYFQWLLFPDAAVFPGRPMLWPTIRSAQKYRPKVVLVHDLPLLPTAMYVAMESGAKLAYDAHELYPFLPTVFPRHSMAMWVAEKLLLPFVDLTISVNHNAAQFLNKVYDVEPEIILNAHPSEGAPEQRKDLLRAKFGLPAHQKILLYQGNIERFLRGLESVILSVALLKREDVSVVFMGADPTQGSLVRLAKEAGVWNTRFFIHPSVSQSELLMHTASADAGLIPYQIRDNPNYQNCAPNKLFEFISAGLPILAADQPSLQDVVSKRGIGMNFSMDTPQQIAHAIDTFFAQDLDKFRQATRAAFTELNFRVEGERFSAMIQKLLDSPRPPAHQLAFALSELEFGCEYSDREIISSGLAKVRTQVQQLIKA